VEHVGKNKYLLFIIEAVGVIPQKDSLQGLMYCSCFPVLTVNLPLLNYFNNKDSNTKDKLLGEAYGES